jgi:hypothetical protein
MRRGSRADGTVANPVRSGRKQPQRFRPGSFRLPPLHRIDSRSARADIPRMTVIQLHLPDDLGASLEARARDADYADVADYMRDLIRAE